MVTVESFSDQLRRIVDGCGLSRHFIAQRTGIAESTLSRFMAGKGGMNTASLDRLSAFLRITLQAGGPRRRDVQAAAKAAPGRPAKRGRA